MHLNIMRAFLVLGLVAHKAVWEVLKRRARVPQKQEHSSPVTSLVKLAKITVLVFLVCQTIFLDLFPILSEPRLLQMIGSVTYLAGLMIAIIGRLQLGANWVDLEDYQVLPNQSLIVNGIYRYIRHPIYTGDILLVLGLQLTLNSWLVLAVPLLVLIVVRQAIVEESLLATRFTDYGPYSSQTKRFIPFIV